MEGNVPVGGGANPPPNPQLPWLRTAAVVVPGVQHPLPKHSDKLLPKFNPDDKEPAECPAMEKRINTLIKLEEER